MDLTDDDIHALETLSVGGSIDYSIWPHLLSRLIPRLEKIVQNEFPIPPVPQSSPLNPPPPSSPPLIQSQVAPASQPLEDSSQITADSAQLADKENITPTPVRHATSCSSSTIAPGSLPPQILSVLNSIFDTLNTYFTTYPPHTIQRLSELILNPKLHYRNLPAYVHAVDRVVHVTSGANIYPLPAAIPDAAGAKILINGMTAGAGPESISWGSSTQTLHGLGSDESLGGALLTPISWLKPAVKSHGSAAIELEGEVRTESTETIDGPNGAGSIETVSVSVNGVSSTTLAGIVGENNEGGLRAEGGVTQGELLRQEQQAGVVPISQLAHTHPNGDGEEDEVPHARGPEEIGMEDMGPQGPGCSLPHGIQGIDVEAAVGRKAEDIEDEVSEQTAQTPKREADEPIEHETKRLKDERDESDATNVTEVQENSNAGMEGKFEKESMDTTK